MKIVTTTRDFLQYTTDALESMKYIKQAGFKYVDYAFDVDYDYKKGIFGEDDFYLDKVKNTVKELELCLVQAHAPYYSFIFDKDISHLIEATIKCVKACSEFNIPVLVVHTGYQRNLSKEETFQKNKEFFVPILEAAEKCGVKVLAENFNKMEFDDIYWIDNATDLKEFIEFVNHPNLYAVWDAGHANLQEMSQCEELKILKDYVLALHIHDNNGDADRHMVPFTGTMSVDSLMQGLVEIGYKGYFTFETENIFRNYNQNRRICTDESRLLKVPIDLRIKAEKMLYEIGKTILQAYDCFEK